jgi:hypothetical protein
VGKGLTTHEQKQQIVAALLGHRVLGREMSRRCPFVGVEFSLRSLAEFANMVSYRPGGLASCHMTNAVTTSSRGAPRDATLEDFPCTGQTVMPILGPTVPITSNVSA